MSISIKKYVDITSGVGAGAAVKERELIMRIFTSNPLVPAGSVMEMTELNDVITTFGADSEEAKRATPYFGWVSKIITKAKKISFAHYNSTATASPPSIVGGTPGLTDIDAWKLITNGGVKLTVGSDVYNLSDMNFSAAASLSAVAGIIQTKLTAVLAGATVVYNVDRFNVNFTGHAVPATVTVAAGTTTNIAPQLGWTTAAGMNTSAGSSAVTILDQVVEADNNSDNYGSIVFAGEPLDIADIEAVGAWNSAQNNKYKYLVPVTLADYVTYYGVLQTYNGLELTIVNDDNTEYDEQIPGIILGATDYTQRNASQNYMFQQFSGISPKVDDNDLANAIDGTRVNYYGQTKSAGQGIAFYQNGLVCGVSTSPTQMNVYANEQWFKAAATAQLLKFLIDSPIVPATEEGRGMVLLNMQDLIDRAKFNGTIVIGKDLTVDQKAYIYAVTGDPLAWHQVQTLGYWLDAKVTSEDQANGTTKYIVDYILVYSKADAVSKITGRDILI